MRPKKQDTFHALTISRSGPSTHATKFRSFTNRSRMSARSPQHTGVIMALRVSADRHSIATTREIMLLMGIARQTRQRYTATAALRECSTRITHSTAATTGASQISPRQEIEPASAQHRTTSVTITSPRAQHRPPDHTIALSLSTPLSLPLHSVLHSARTSLRQHGILRRRIPTGSLNVVPFTPRRSNLHLELL